MAAVYSIESRGYRYVEGVFQYSAAVGALAGFEIERARFRRALPMELAVQAIEAHLKRIARPMNALCACELRSPKPFTEGGFVSFNRDYVQQLERWGLPSEGRNPVARTNICPAVAPPASVSVHAFSYAVPKTSNSGASFIIAGSGEAPEGRGDYRDHAIRLGDRSPDGLREKARWVLSEMERRMSALSAGWTDTTAASLYTVYDVHPFVEVEIAARGAMASGLEWHYARPPVVDLDYEMDARATAREFVID